LLTTKVSVRKKKNKKIKEERRGGKGKKNMRTPR
jgi:hypothetical protein